MYLKYIDNDISDIMCEVFKNITNKAKIKIDNISYDVRSATVVIIANLNQNKVFDKINAIEILLKDVNSVRIVNNTKGLINEITLLFGFKISASSNLKCKKLK